MPLASLALVASLLGGAPDTEARWHPPPIIHGWDLREDWDDTWRRFQDRTGRPDPQGTLLQPAPELQGPEYELSLGVARQPYALERDWASQARGARVFINSDDEFRFFNEVRLKERVQISPGAQFGIRLDRRQLAEIDSTIVRLAVAWPDIRGTGAFVEIRPVARLEKPDLDAEALAGWTRPNLVTVAARVFFFDPANNASDALAQHRDKPQEIRVRQQGPVMGASAELEVDRVPNLRVQLSVGGIFPSRQSLSFADESRFPYERRQAALLTGAALEYALPMAPVQVGASALWVQTSDTHSNSQGALLSRTPELELKARVYALAQLGQGTRAHTLLEAALNFRRTELPTHSSEFGSVPKDRSWLAQLRATWMPTRVFGLELAYLMVDRKAEGEGELAPYLTATHHRLSTRFAFAFEPYLRFSFGVGWDLDDAGNRYDKGGMTLSLRW